MLPLIQNLNSTNRNSSHRFQIPRLLNLFPQRMIQIPLISGSFQNNYINQSSEKVQNTKIKENIMSNEQKSGRNTTFDPQNLQNKRISEAQRNVSNQEKLSEKNRLLVKMEIDSKIKKMMNDKAQQQKQQEDNRMRMKQNVISQLYGWQEESVITSREPKLKEIPEDDSISHSIQPKIDWKEIEEMPPDTRNLAVRTSTKQNEIQTSSDPRFSTESKHFPDKRSDSGFEALSYDPRVEASKGKEKIRQSDHVNSQKLDFDTHQPANTAHFNTFGKRENLIVGVENASDLYDSRKSGGHFASRNFQSKENHTALPWGETSQKQDPQESVSQHGDFSSAPLGFEEYIQGRDGVKFSHNFGESNNENNFESGFSVHLESEQVRKSIKDLPSKNNYQGSYKENVLNSRKEEFALTAEMSAKSGSRYREDASNTYHSREELSNSPRYSAEENQNYHSKSENQSGPNKRREIKKDSDYEEEDIAEDLDGGFEDDEVVTGSESKSNYDYAPIQKTNDKKEQTKESEGAGNSSRISGTRRTWQKQATAQDSDSARELDNKSNTQKNDTGNDLIKPTKIVISNDEDEEARQKKQKKLERFIKRKEEERQQVKERRMQSRERSAERITSENQNDISNNEVIDDKSPIGSKRTNRITTPTNTESQKATAKFGIGSGDNTPETSSGRGRSSEKVLKRKVEPNYNRRDSVEENKTGDTPAKLNKTPSNKLNPMSKPPSNLNQKNLTSFKPTNKQLIKNALTNVCLSGDFNKRDREMVFQKLEEIKADNFIVVFKGISGRHDFRGLCSFDSVTGEVKRVYAAAPIPAIVDASMVHSYYRYDSGLKDFKEIPGNKSFSIAVDAIALQPSLFKQSSNTTGSKF